MRAITNLQSRWSEAAHPSLPHRRRTRGMARWSALAVGALVALAGCTATGSGASAVPSAAASAAPSAATIATPSVDQALVADLPASIKQAGVLTAATDPNFPVANYYAANGKTIIGVSPDLLQAVSAVLGLKPQLSAVTLAGIIPALQANRYDLAAMVLSDTPAREKQVDLLDFLQAGQQFLVAKGNPANITTLASLCGKSVAVAQGGAPVAIAQKQSTTCTTAGKQAVNVMQYPTVTQAVLAVEDGRADANIDATTKTYYEVQQSKGKLQAAGTQFDPGPFGWAVPNTNPGLEKAVVGAINDLIKDGVYQQILNKWGISQTAVPAVTVDAAGAAAGASATP